jgi:hypothetical protein
MHELAMMCTRLCNTRAWNLLDFFQGARGQADRQAAATQACRRYAGMRRGPNGRQAGEQLVVGRHAYGWYVGRQRTSGLVRRSGMQSVR